MCTAKITIFEVTNLQVIIVQPCCEVLILKIHFIFLLQCTLPQPGLTSLVASPPQDSSTPTTAGAMSSRTHSPQTAISAHTQSTMSAPQSGGQPPMPAAHGGASPASHVSPERPSHLSGSGSNSDYMRHPPTPTGAAFRPPHEITSPFFANSNGIFRPGFPTPYTPPAHIHPAVLQHSPIASQMQNGTFTIGNNNKY